MNVQALCDSHRRFLWVDTHSHGASHDTTAFMGTTLAKALSQGELDKRFYIVGDDAYKSCLDQLVTPFAGERLSTHQDNFNFYCSHSRIEIGKRRQLGASIEADSNPACLPA